MNEQAYTLNCDKCRIPYKSKEGFPAPQLCPTHLSEQDELSLTDEDIETQRLEACRLPDYTEGAIWARDTLLANAKREERERIIDKLNEYVEQVTKDNNGTYEGNLLIDPMGIATLDYWWQALKGETDDKT